jgi:hypothetical protein
MELYGVLPPGPKLSTTLPLSTPLGFFAPPTSQISPLTTTAPNLCRGHRTPGGRYSSSARRHAPGLTPTTRVKTCVR